MFKNYNFREKKNTKVWNREICIKSFYTVECWLKPRMWLVGLNYNFECDWLIELSDNKLSNNKLSDNNLTTKLVENRIFFKPITIEEIVIFMINLKMFQCINIYKTLD